ncbi:monofunctional biosynthetic peptidoglycan transglycosylase [Salipiger sp. IMCC34102]|nr:monofunctional biosynthetic peptidoglycan transglycosylase [Salipiger sp. IMCC34102]
MKRLARWTLFVIVGGLVLAFMATLSLRLVGPWMTPYQIAESRRLGGIAQEWVPMENIAPAMARSVVAAEDANFCRHWGLDVNAIRAALESGAARGGSTISQQVVKNVFLWQGRSWVRKSIEAVWTPVTEAVWPKRRILELYLNEVEFAEGVFGVGAAAPHYFGVDAGDLTDTQAARLAMVLPDPKDRNAANPTARQRERTASIMDGAATIAADGRAACFED